MRNYLMGTVLTVAFVVGGSAAAFAAPAAPDPGTLAGNLANGTGTATLNAITDVLPAIVPILVAFWAIGFVWKKVKPSSGGVK